MPRLKSVVPVILAQLRSAAAALAALALALAGRLAAQPRLADTAGSLPNDTPQFGILVLAHPAGRRPVFPE